MIKRTRLIIISFILISSTLFNACNNEKESNKDDDYIEKWQEQKYSMFIHWGLYSIPAGIWNGKHITGYSEQIKGHANIPKDEYRRLTAKFNPVNWNADSVVSLAKRAGMKSIIITAKHHDGFCLFNSEFTDFDVMDATPYKKDILKDLSDACRREKLKFGVYYSLIDWNYEGALPFTSVQNSDSIPPQHHQYNINQVRELLTKYGEISEIWFDMGSPTTNQSKELRTLVKNLQASCLVSGRIWNDQGDFVVMGDNKKPEYKIGVPWQTPASIFNETWGYRSWQKRSNFELKAKEKLKDLLTVVSSGGNYLLNIGLKSDGSIVPFEQKVLENIGNWLNKNKEAVYATHPTPIISQKWGIITSKQGKLFLHVYSPTDKIKIKGLKNTITKAYALNNKKKLLKTKTTEEGVEIELASKLFTNENITVITLEYNEELNYINPYALHTNNSGIFSLTSENADSIHSYSGHDYYSTKPTLIKLAWDIKSELEKESIADISITTDKTQSYLFKVNNKAFLLSKEKISNGKLNQQLNLGKLNTNKSNHITLDFETPSNPNEDLGLKKVNIIIK